MYTRVIQINAALEDSLAANSIQSKIVQNYRLPAVHDLRGFINPLALNKFPRGTVVGHVLVFRRYIFIYLFLLLFMYCTVY